MARNIPKRGIVIETEGNGLWSSEMRKVKFTKMTVRNLMNSDCLDEFGSEDYQPIEPDFAELRVYFLRKTWNPDKHGLIYTDRGWIREFRKRLSMLGYSPKAIKEVEFSEQGMQGDNYVSLDCEKTFLKEFLGRKYPKAKK